MAELCASPYSSSTDEVSTDLRCPLITPPASHPFTLHHYSMHPHRPRCIIRSTMPPPPITNRAVS
eukprot:scaffold37338_cov42-Cyclotella_meneghiniana.AAC.1